MYCNNHGYNYVWADFKRELATPFDHKLLAILDLPTDNEWWFWIDDDAFFMQMQTKLEFFISNVAENIQLVFAKSPINPLGGWTYLSSGNFFFRNSDLVHNFFQMALETDLKLVRGWWNEAQLGMFTNGDQDKIVYTLLNNRLMNEITTIRPYHEFNLRPYHFFYSHNEHFLVHFATPTGSKLEEIDRFQHRFGFVDSSLTELN